MADAVTATPPMRPLARVKARAAGRGGMFVLYLCLCLEGSFFDVVVWFCADRFDKGDGYVC